MNNTSLKKFVSDWKESYENANSKNLIFNQDFIRSLSQSQKTVLCKILYHIRGNFYKFFWYLGSLSPSLEQKEIIIKNIADEFGAFEKFVSHEKLYYEFADELGVNIKNEIISEEFNFDWIKEFNFSPIRMILTGEYDLAWSAFCAYELLDNVDYSLLNDCVAKNLNISKRGQKFFLVHTTVEHYEEPEKLLRCIWDKNPEVVVEGFEFVKNKQLNIWDRLGKVVNSVN